MFLIRLKGFFSNANIIETFDVVPDKVKFSKDGNYLAMSQDNDYTVFRFSISGLVALTG